MINSGFDVSFKVVAEREGKIIHKALKLKQAQSI